jgi:hypothetical protein
MRSGDLGAGTPARAWARVFGVVLAAVMCLVVAPGVALGLPEGRVYEMVSPPYKAGYAAINIEAVAPNGESVAFYTPGVFAEPPFKAPGGPEVFDYIAHRTAAGWRTTPLMPPAGVLAFVTNREVSSTLESTLALGIAGANLEAAVLEGTEEEFQLHNTSTPDTSENWQLGGVALRYPGGQPINLTQRGASDDLCHLFFFLSDSPAGAALLPEGAAADGSSGRTQLYELDRGCHGEPPALRLVGVANHDGPHEEPALLDRKCVAGMGTGDLGTAEELVGNVRSWFDAAAADGEEVFFTEFCGERAANSGPERQLFVRLGGARTLEVSKPVGEACLEVPCPGAGGRAVSVFRGASRDGSRVFFTAPLLAGQPPLVPGDLDGSRNLYMASIGCPAGEPGCEVAGRQVTSLAEVSHDAGGAAEVQGVVRVVPDGSRVYFVARGVLSGVNGEGRGPVQGADNLYMYENDESHSAGRVAFIAQLCSGTELSGVVPDANCPGGGFTDVDLWNINEPEAQVAGEDGRFLVFATVAQLSPGDSDNARDVYRYDADTERLERVSIGERGAGANGNCDDSPGTAGCDATIALATADEAPVAEQHEMGSRAVSEDGSRIVFTSVAALSEDATNGLSNAYEWHEEPDGAGRVSLLSTGNASAPVTHVVMSPSGRDVFFITSQGLVPQDTDGVGDIYDARLEHESGFSQAPVEPEECSGDGCQGPLTNPAPLLVPGSAVQAPGGNLAASPAATTPKKAAPRCAKGKRRSPGKCLKVKTKSRPRAKKRGDKRRVK